MTPFHRPTLSLAIALIALPALAHAQSQSAAQATVKPDDRFRFALGAGISYASGNTDASSINLSGETVRATADSRLRFGGNFLRQRSNGQRTADNFALGTEYDRDLTPDWFSLAKLDFQRDKLANLSSRASIFGGGGRHVVRSDALVFDLSAGLGYTRDAYDQNAVVFDQLRSGYGRLEGLLAEETRHKFSASTSFHQKFSFFPSLRGNGGFRTVFDSGLAVDMTPTLSLTVSLNQRHDSDPGQGVKPNDTLFVTGLAVKLD